MHPWVRSGGWRKITRGECIDHPGQYSGSDRHRAEYQWECESGNERKWKWPIITCPFVCLPAAMFTIWKYLWQTQIRRWPQPGHPASGVSYSAGMVNDTWECWAAACAGAGCCIIAPRLYTVTRVYQLFIHLHTMSVHPDPGTRPHPRNQQFKGSRWPELVCFKCFVFPTSLLLYPHFQHHHTCPQRQQWTIPSQGHKKEVKNFPNHLYLSRINACQF